MLQVSVSPETTPKMTYRTFNSIARLFHSRNLKCLQKEPVKLDDQNIKFLHHLLLAQGKWFVTNMSMLQEKCQKLTGAHSICPGPDLPGLAKHVWGKEVSQFRYCGSQGSIAFNAFNLSAYDTAFSPKWHQFSQHTFGNKLCQLIFEWYDLSYKAGSLFVQDS